ncbi:uncharacterized protein PFLUO_LOCUS7589 [Penicillium psychrofluorescens]|uniref:uncharacterized protein n=1 Tax=Penicillium psychrofluorescens TaxID=3158075 RepID=UPI003CCCFFD2
MQVVQQDGQMVLGEQPVFADDRAVASAARGLLHKGPVPKNVAFELLLDDNSKVRARIPMRVQIYPHDTTDSIVTTVKNFYGIYDAAASGVSFEDEHGITLIARYENLRNNMTVYVRVIPVQPYPEAYGEPFYGGFSVEARKRPSLGEPFQMASAMSAAQALDPDQSPSRPSSRLARKRSTSPSSRSLRSTSQHKQCSHSGLKSRGSSVHGGFPGDEAYGYSDSDGEYGSISGTRKARSDQFASSEISMENILQDGRRKRPKFDSSELPLFAPPQVPLTMSTSSISPQRRSVGQEGASPFARPTHRPYSYQQPLPSPQSYGHSEHVYGIPSGRNTMYATPVIPDHGHRLRDRVATGPFINSAGRVSGAGVLPTPDPTIASCISDEDVAMQLIRLGDASNFSHGRTSASTLDDAFSGAADAASSAATSDGEDFSEEEDDLPRRQRQESSPMLPPGTTKRQHKRLDDILPSADSSEQSSDGADEFGQYDRVGAPVKSEADYDLYRDYAPKTKKPKIRPANMPPKPRSQKMAPLKLSKGAKASTSGAPRKPKMPGPVGMDKTTASFPPLSPNSARKVSGSSVNFQHQLGADEEDLSTKPRCQRCRKSKKGCDRQRPCGRCKDAGIGIDGCVSEDEGNGRKGRYGRHMGVAVKKSIDGSIIEGDNEFLPLPTTTSPIASASDIADKNKKRKR